MRLWRPHGRLAAGQPRRAAYIPSRIPGMAAGAVHGAVTRLAGRGQSRGRPRCRAGGGRCPAGGSTLRGLAPGPLARSRSFASRVDLRACSIGPGARHGECLSYGLRRNQAVIAGQCHAGTLLLRVAVPGSLRGREEMNWFWLRSRRHRRVTSAGGLAHDSAGQPAWRKAAQRIGYAGLSVVLAGVRRPGALVRRAAPGRARPPRRPPHPHSSPGPFLMPRWAGS